MNQDAHLAKIAERQLGLVTRSQALASGMSPSALRRRCESGRWRRVRPGVFAIAGVPPSSEQQILAACLATNGVASHGTAMALHLDLPVPHAPIEVTVVGVRHPNPPGLVVHRTKRLARLDRILLRRVPVTSGERLVVDLSGRMTVDELGRVTDALLRRRRLSMRRLRACLATLESGPGRHPSTVHEVIRSRVTDFHPGESAWELAVLDMLVSAGLPRPVQQYAIQIDGQRYRADLAYPESRVLIELDSWEWHRSEESFHRDRQRMSRLVGAGFRVLLITPRMPAGDVVAVVSKALEAAQARPA